MGILGGFVVGVGMLDLAPMAYYQQTVAALTPTHFAMGLFKSAIYGAIVAIAGCLRGIQCGRSAAAVGEAATSAVVTGIVLIVVASGLLTVVYDVMGLP
jgi:phospholipid/cholesterol/gamma-HCH transport system permease protein